MKFRKFVFCSVLASLFALALCVSAMAETEEKAVDVDALIAQFADLLDGDGDNDSVKAMDVDSNYSSEGHSGDSETDAYVIDSKEDFAVFTANVILGKEPAGKYYRLEIDLLISENEGFANWDPIGLRDTPFKGHFDGNGRTIVIASRRDENGSGSRGASLFGAVDTKGGYAVKDLKVEGAIGGSAAGGIVYILSSGTIENCEFSGTVRAFGANTAGIAGGIVGAQQGGSVKNCRVSAKSTVISDGITAGGIVGVRSGGEVVNCNSAAALQCSGYKGGIIGMASSRSGVSGNTFTGADKEIGYVESEDKPTTSSSGGGCSAGAASIAMIALAAFALRKK